MQSSKQTYHNYDSYSESVCMCCNYIVGQRGLWSTCSGIGSWWDGCLASTPITLVSCSI